MGGQCLLNRADDSLPPSMKVALSDLGKTERAGSDFQTFLPKNSMFHKSSTFVR